MNLLRFLLLTLVLASQGATAMTGIFWQPQLRDNQASRESWQSLMRSVRQQGFDTLILQWTRYGDAFADASETAKLVERTADARRAGLKIVIGLYADPDFFTRQQQPDLALENYLNRLRVNDLEQVQHWLDAAGIAPDGWYISAEIDDHNWRNEARRQPLLKWLNETRSGLSKLSDKPVYISSFFAGNMEPDAYARFMQQLHSTGLHIWVQDGSGVGTLTEAQRQLYLNASANCSNGRAEGVVYELFKSQAGATFSAQPKSSAEINTLLAMPSACAKSRVYFSLRYLPAARNILAL